MKQPLETGKGPGVVVHQQQRECIGLIRHKRKFKGRGSQKQALSIIMIVYGLSFQTRSGYLYPPCDHVKATDWLANFPEMR
jgi:hypothetical protein